MPTYQTNTPLSEPRECKPIDPFDLHYMGAMSRHLAHELVVSAFKKSGLSKADLARRLGWRDRSRITKLLNTPANITVETFGELLFAIDGSSPSYSQTWPCRDKHTNAGRPEWLKEEPSTSTSAIIIYYSADAQSKLTRTPEAAL